MIKCLTMSYWELVLLVSSWTSESIQVSFVYSWLLSRWFQNAGAFQRKSVSWSEKPVVRTDILISRQIHSLVSCPNLHSSLLFCPTPLFSFNVNTPYVSLCVFIYVHACVYMLVCMRGFILCVCVSLCHHLKHFHCFLSNM